MTHHVVCESVPVWLLGGELDLLTKQVGSYRASRASRHGCREFGGGSFNRRLTVSRLWPRSLATSCTLQPQPSTSQTSRISAIDKPRQHMRSSDCESNLSSTASSNGLLWLTCDENKHSGGKDSVLGRLRRPRSCER